MFVYSPTTNHVLPLASAEMQYGKYDQSTYNAAGYYFMFRDDPIGHNLKWFEELVLDTPVQQGEFGYIQRYVAVPKPLSFDSAKAQLIEYIDNRRKVAESSGFITPDGHKIRSDQKTQQTVAEAVRKIEEGVIQEPINWLSTDGFMSLTLLQLKQFGAGIAMHVQCCFNRQKQLWDEVQAIDLTSETAKEQLFAVAVDSGWPTPTE